MGRGGGSRRPSAGGAPAAASPAAPAQGSSSSDMVSNCDVNHDDFFTTSYWIEWNMVICGLKLITGLFVSSFLEIFEHENN